MQDLPDGIHRAVQQEEEIYVAPLPGITSGIRAVEEKASEAFSVEILETLLQSLNGFPKRSRQALHGSPIVQDGSPLPTRVEYPS
jgi:hypothetical protein